MQLFPYQDLAHVITYQKVTNLYYTDARFDTRLGTKTTTNLSEGTNLYFTNARADARIASADLQDLSNVGFSSTWCYRR